MPHQTAQERIDAETGSVKWFDPRKGFGFIVGPEGQDIFVHYTQIEGDGYRILSDGDRVTYSAELGDRGWHATSVQRDTEQTAPQVRIRPVAHPSNRSKHRTTADHPD